MLIFFLVFFILLIIGFPISLSIGASAILGCISLGYPILVIGQKMVSGMDSFLLISVPLFILAGNLMNAGKITDRIFNFSNRLVGWIPGGLGHANVVASMIFAGMSGAATADAGGLGTIEMEAMTSNGYDKDFSAAVTASSSVIGPIFPPSIPLIIYGSIASVSVSKLFMGGVIPSILICLTLMILIFVISIRKGYQRTKFNLRLLGRDFVRAILSLLTPIIILSGFTFGFFTPTEASSVAVLYALIISLFVYKSISWNDLKKCLLDSVLTSANTLFIIGTSTLFTYVLVKEGVATDISNFMLSVSSNPKVVLLLINIVLLLLGMFMEPGAILTLMLPILIPIATSLGIDLVHFGIIVVLNLMIGQVTPPFGVCLFIISDIAKIGLDRMYKSIIPFIIPLIVVLLLSTYIEPLVTYLPNILI